MISAYHYTMNISGNKVICQLPAIKTNPEIINDLMIIIPQAIVIFLVLDHFP